FNISTFSTKRHRSLPLSKTLGEITLRHFTHSLCLSLKPNSHRETPSTASPVPTPEEPPWVAPDHHRSSSSPRAREELPLFKNAPAAASYGAVGDSKRHRSCSPSR
ncbi:hypothetical protein V8G54_018288, partial [Vigna mungo]